MGGWLNLISVCVVKIDNGSYYFSISKFCQTINLVFAPFSVKLSVFSSVLPGPHFLPLGQPFYYPHDRSKSLCIEIVCFYLYFGTSHAKFRFVSFLLLNSWQIKKWFVSLVFKRTYNEIAVLIYLAIPIIIILFKEQLLAWSVDKAPRGWILSRIYLDSILIWLRWISRIFSLILWMTDKLCLQWLLRAYLSLPVTVCVGGRSKSKGSLWNSTTPPAAVVEGYTYVHTCHQGRVIRE